MVALAARSSGRSTEISSQTKITTVVLGFDFRRVRSRRGVWRANYTPKLKKRTALLRKLKDVFRRYRSQQ
jgi:hypothetical protein